MHVHARTHTHTFLDVKLSVFMFVHAMLNKVGRGERDPVRRWNAQGGPSLLHPLTHPFHTHHLGWGPCDHREHKHREGGSLRMSVVARMPSQRLVAVERMSCMLSHAECKQADLSMFES